MIKKLFVAIALVAMVVACTDNKKKEAEVKPVCISELAQNADSLAALDQITVAGKLTTVCQESRRCLLAGENGEKVTLNLTDSVNVDTTFIGKTVAATGKLTVTVIDSAAVAKIEAKIAEQDSLKNCCKDAKKEAGCSKNGKKAENSKDAKKDEGCCKEKAQCCVPKVGDKIYSMNVTKIEVVECNEKGE